MFSDKQYPQHSEKIHEHVLKKMQQACYKNIFLHWDKIIEKNIFLLNAFTAPFINIDNDDLQEIDLFHFRSLA